MLTLENRIDGILIGCAYVYNIGSLDKKGRYSYAVEYHRFDKEPPVLKFEIKHKKDDGVEKLSLLVYEGMNGILTRE